VAEFLQAHAVARPARTPGSDIAASTTVATTPLQPGPAQTVNEPATPSAFGRSAAAAQHAVVEADHVVPDTASAARNGSDARDGASERRHESAFTQGGGRTARAAADVPASMVFPGQMTFAAAIERAMPSVPTLPAAPATPEQLAAVVPQVVKSMQMQVKAGGGDMTLTLTPEHLGTVTIELRVDQQKVSASLGADTAAVRGWIAAHEQDLKAGLADLGLQLEEFVVRDDDPRQQREREQQQPQRRKQTRAEEPVFEVLV
jgi:flagellar hook-length control protein FliK